jgi:hypothetical protein
LTKLDKDTYLAIQFTEEEVKSLIEILSFSKETCAFMEQQEAIKGSASGVRSMQRIKEDSIVLLDIITASVTIGEPPDGVYH